MAIQFANQPNHLLIINFQCVFKSMSMEMLWNVPSGLHLHLQPLSVPSGLHLHLQPSNVLSVTHLWLWMYAHSVNVVSCMDVWRICKLITCWKNENPTICKYIYHHTDHITDTLTKLPIVNTLVLVYIYIYYMRL